MKLSIAVFAGVASAGLLEKRAGPAQKKGHENAARVITKTAFTKHTVFVNPTVTRTLTGTTVLTDKITTTKTLPTVTTTVTGSSTSTVAAQPGFTAASAALPASNVNVVAKSTKTTSHLTKATAHTTHTTHKETHAAHTSKHSTKHTTAKHTSHHKRDAEPAKPSVAIAAGGVVTVTVTQAAKPFITHYNPAKTEIVNHQKTKHVQRIVATTTIKRTQTVVVPRATHYAACQSDNLVGWTWGKGGSASGNATFGSHNATSSNRVGISSVILVSGTTAKTFDASTSAQCCIKCQNTAGCVGSQWRSGVCVIHVRPAQFAACSAHQSQFTLGSFFANPLSFLSVDEGLILSNGRCGGTWKFGGFSS